MKQFLQKTLITVAALTAAQTALAAVDWTPYLEGMQDSCNYRGDKFFQAMGYRVESYISHDGTLEYDSKGRPQKSNIPNALRSSVAGFEAKTTNAIEDMHNSTIRLRNATAFGHPITKIEYIRKWGETELIVTFANRNFSNLKSRFTLDINGTKYPVGANKYWTETGSVVEVNGVWQDHYQSISKAQYDNLRREEYYRLAAIDNNGWSFDTPTGADTLKFNTSTKQITCVYYW